jgi:hypothetical protein
LSLCEEHYKAKTGKGAAAPAAAPGGAAAVADAPAA